MTTPKAFLFNMICSTNTLSFESEPVNNQARTIMGKITQDWKFIAQLLAIAFIAGGIVQINYTLQHKVGMLETSNDDKTRAIILIEERFEILKRDNNELKQMIQRLQERLEAKKMVNRIGIFSEDLCGEWIVKE